MNAEARAKMEVADQAAELFQLRQPKDQFDKSSLVLWISSVFKSLGLMRWGKLMDVCFNDGHGPYMLYE